MYYCTNIDGRTAVALNAQSNFKSIRTLSQDPFSMTVSPGLIEHASTRTSIISPSETSTVGLGTAAGMLNVCCGRCEHGMQRIMRVCVCEYIRVVHKVTW